MARYPLVEHVCEAAPHGVHLFEVSLELSALDHGGEFSRRSEEDDFVSLIKVEALVLECEPGVVSFDLDSDGEV